MHDSSSSQVLTDHGASSSTDSHVVGLLEVKDMSGKVVNSTAAVMAQMMNCLTSLEGRLLFADQELIIGRDGNRWWTRLSSTFLIRAF
jgi:hypothetical protein